MSSIPTRAIDGDVAIGRHVSIGGKGIVRSNLTVGHNLTVEGWLEAPNIKGAAKGMFKDVAQLEAAYPEPEEGWWALVAVEASQGSDHLGQLYIATGGKWVAQTDSSGNPLLKGNPTLDVTQYREEVDALEERLDTLAVELDDVVEFDSPALGVSVVNKKCDKKSTDDGCSVVANADSTGMIKFVLKDTSGSTTYYADWADGDVFGTATSGGKLPVAGKIYILKAQNTCYRWDAAKGSLALVGSGLVIGTGNGNAFEGARGVALEKKMTTAEGSIKTLQTDVTMAQETADMAQCTADGNAALLQKLDVWESKASAEGVTISTRSPQSETAAHSVTIGVATSSAAGVMSAEQVKAVSALRTDVTTAEGSIKTLQTDVTMAQETADMAQCTADGNAALLQKLDVWESKASAEGVTISTRSPQSETAAHSVTIGVATSSAAGVMSAEQVKAVSALRTDVTTAEGSIKTLQTTVASQGDSLDYVSEEFFNFSGTKGQADGLAPLDGAGKVSSQYLPSYVDDVVEFSEMRSGIAVLKEKGKNKSTDDGCKVVYNVDASLFVLYGWKDSSTMAYFADWVDGDKFGTSAASGRQPEGGKIYVATGTNKSYRWSGSALVVIATDLALGYTSETAFPGDKGAALQTDMTTAEGSIKTLQSTQEVQGKILATLGTEYAETKGDVAHLNETMGAYSDRPSVVLTASATGYVVDSNGAKVAKSGWAMAEFVAEKGNVYLFKPGATDGNVSVFAESITSVETRAVDYTYTYNEDGSIATAQATYNGKTHTYTYAYDAGGAVTITEVGVGVVDALPMTYTTTVGSYSPLVRLNADAELPKDGYCRYMSHFKGNSAIKVVVSYKVDSADLTMRVTRDGVLASISTQLGNLSQKEDETRGLLDKMSESYVEVRMLKDQNVVVDGKTLTIPARVKTKIYPMRSLSLYIGYVENFLQYFDASHWDTSQVTSLGNLFYSMKNPHLGKVDCGGWDVSNVKDMSNLFRNCSSLSVLDVSGWDTGNVTNMQSMFSGCSSVSVLDVSGWDVSKATDMAQMFSGVNVTTLNLSNWKPTLSSMMMMFYGAKKVTALDMSGFNTQGVTNMYCLFFSCQSLTTLDVSGWDTQNVTNVGLMFAGCTALTDVIFGGGWGKNTAALALDLSPVGSAKSYKLTDATWASMLTMYDRKTAGLAEMTIKLSTKHNVPSGWEEQMTARGYIITKA